MAGTNEQETGAPQGEASTTAEGQEAQGTENGSPESTWTPPTREEYEALQTKAETYESKNNTLLREAKEGRDQRRAEEARKAEAHQKAGEFEEANKVLNQHLAERDETIASLQAQVAELAPQAESWRGFKANTQKAIEERLEKGKDLPSHVVRGVRLALDTGKLEEARGILDDYQGTVKPPTPIDGSGSPGRVQPPSDKSYSDMTPEEKRAFHASVNGPRSKPFFSS